MDGTAVFAWALLPGADPDPEGAIEWVDDPDGDRDRATLAVRTADRTDRFVADLGNGAGTTEDANGLWLAPTE